MSTIANLDVNLFAHTKKFNSPLKKSGTVFGTFSKRLGSFSGAKIAGGLALIGGSVAALAGVGRALSSINAEFDKIDALAKYSDSVGATITEMKALQLQGDLTGTSSATLESGIQRYIRTLGEAKAGLSTGTKAMEAFGFSAEDLSKLPLTDQLGKVADKIREQETAADKAALAYQLFGRKGQEMLTFFEGGSAGIQAAAADIERFNIGLSRVDAAQVEIANDAWTRMETLTSGIWQTIAVEAAPTMTALIEMFTDVAAEADGFSGIVETGFSILNAGIGFALDGWNLFVGGVKVGTGFVVGSIADIVGMLARAEAALVSVGGQKFDFGVGAIAEQANAAAAALTAAGEAQFTDGINGTASADFEARLEEIRKRAEETAKKPIELPPIPEAAARAPVDIGAIASSFWANVTNAFQDSPLANTPEQQTQDRPTVSALARGSSAAQSFLNQLTQTDTDKEIGAQLEKTREQQKELAAKNLEGIKSVVTAIGNAAGVVVQL